MTVKELHTILGEFLEAHEDLEVMHRGSECALSVDLVTLYKPSDSTKHWPNLNEACILLLDVD